MSEDNFKDHSFERMEWPTQSPNLNPMQHVWDYLIRHVAALSPLPRSLHELRQGFFISVFDNVIGSMENESICCQCAAVKQFYLLLEPIFVVFPYKTVMYCFHQECLFFLLLLEIMFVLNLCTFLHYIQ